ncbi:MAG: 2-amino-4-hydroxy-6-hydroxymethyldihydropteridine diphosphokinase [Syntrophobacterales bacterium]|nr:MAG: 2-amino-4-hydroxy-6-hydroxymethyldihydropteridine diphosphokinase [Syntrophobacterales bacterium]
MGNIAFIGIGSNVGDKVKKCRQAITKISQWNENTLLAQSSFYKTEPIGYTQQDWFINCVIEIETSFTAYELLHVLEDIEISMGRERILKWGPRIIDLDILFLNDEIIRCKELTVPHPEVQNRAFVLVPLCEIAGDYIHPLLNKPISQLMADVGDEQGIKKLGSSPKKLVS